jgi:hypothetical protein
MDLDVYEIWQKQENIKNYVNSFFDIMFELRKYNGQNQLAGRRCRKSLLNHEHLSKQLRKDLRACVRQAGNPIGNIINKATPTQTEPQGDN